MNIKLIKYLDELFGPLVCLVFHIYNSIKKIFIKPQLLPVRKILLIKFFGMGSIIMMYPMIRALRTSFPDSKITLFTLMNNKEICELTGIFDDVVTVKSDTIPQIISGIIKKILVLRREKFDAAIDLEFFSKSSTIICYLTGSRNRVGFFLVQIGILLKMMWRGNLLTHQVFYNAHKHTTEVFLALAHAIIAKADASTVGGLTYAPIRIPKDAQDKIGKIMHAQLDKDDKLILININASPLCMERRWPMENFMKLVELLSFDNDNLKFIFIGDKSDVPYVKSFFDGTHGGIDKKRLVNLTGQLSLAELAALISRAELFITNDSGPLHMAVSLKKSTVSFFGPETPVRYGPKGDMHTVFYADIYCSPCLNTYNQKTAPCNGRNICMHAIPSEEVYRAIKEKYGL